jgi:ribonuclease-3
VSIDGGFEAAQALVKRLFGETIMSTTIDSWRKDAKTELQEWLQARHVPVPSYRISATHGQAHAQTFEVECDVPQLKWRATGVGRSRRAAEQASAQQLLDRIKGGELDVPLRKGHPGA